MASNGQEPQENAAALTSVAITIQLVVLAVAFVIGRALERIRFQWMGEAGAALLLGLVVGLTLKAAGVGAKLAAAIAFKGGIFFYILLPTIMFDAGYSLDTRMFIRNVGSLSLYAFVGTTISCFVVGLMMWAFGRWGWCHPMPLLANLTFGALISATDPVTVLAVFQRLNAQPDLYMNVFGESVLNDAVGMVLYNVIASFLDGKSVNAGSVFAGIGMFVGIFLGSTAIGIAIGLLAAVIFRSRYFYSGPVLIQGEDRGSKGTAEAMSGGASTTFEVGLAVVFAYGSYLVADAARCSGIVAVVVNGMVMKMYVAPNLSGEAAHKIETLFKSLAGLFELFVFCYIGTTMFLQDEEYNIVGYTALSLLALAVSRAANILPCTAAVNLLRPLERHISPQQQLMLWWSGLRGAMAFALSVEADDRFEHYGKVMKTCTFYIIFITVLFNGGTAAYLLRRLGLRAEDTPALILQHQDSLSHMHGFGHKDCVLAVQNDGEDGDEGGPGPGGSRRAGGGNRKQGSNGGEAKGQPQQQQDVREAEEAEVEKWEERPPCGDGLRGAEMGGGGGGGGGGKRRRWVKRGKEPQQQQRGEEDEEDEDEEDRLLEDLPLGGVKGSAATVGSKSGTRPGNRSSRISQRSPRGLAPAAASAAAREEGEEDAMGSSNSTMSGSSGRRSLFGGLGSGGGGGSSRRFGLASTSSLLERVRALNDGRLVDRFDEFDRRVSRLLIHPDNLREAELATGPQGGGGASFRAALAAKQLQQQDSGSSPAGGPTAGQLVPGSHAAPQTLTSLLSPSSSQTSFVTGAAGAAAAMASAPASIVVHGGGTPLARAWGPPAASGDSHDDDAAVPGVAALPDGGTASSCSVGRPGVLGPLEKFGSISLKPLGGGGGGPSLAAAVAAAAKGAPAGSGSSGDVLGGTMQPAAAVSLGRALAPPAQQQPQQQQQ